MNKKSLLAFAAGALMLVACGDDVTEVNEIHQDGMVVLAKGEKLSEQTCDKTNVGEMLFVMDSSEAFICDGESWQTLKGADGRDGEKGDKGETGADGVKGAKGADGKDGEDGDNGNNGTSCTAQSVKNAAGLGGLEVTCGKIVIDTIWNGNDGNGCSVKDEGDGTVTITCGDGDDATSTIIYKAMCGMEPYDPVKSFCLGGELYELCGGKKFDLETQYCKMGEMVENYGRLEDARDDQVYKTVEIGDQTWMAENLNYSVNPGEQSWCGGGESETTKEGDCDLYGRLYTWAATVGKSENECGSEHKCDLSDVKNEKGEVRGVCPEGWHLPTYDEWEALFTAVGGSDIAGKILKSVSGWYNDGNGEGAYGFSALPAGYRDYNGEFYHAGYIAPFWSASEFSEYLANAMNLDDDEDANLGRFNKGNGNAVRCLQD